MGCVCKIFVRFFFVVNANESEYSECRNLCSCLVCRDWLNAFSENTNTYLSAGCCEVGLRLRKAFNHFVFIDEELATESLRSCATLLPLPGPVKLTTPELGPPPENPRGELGSKVLPRNSSFCEEFKKREMLRTLYINNFN